MAERGRGLDPRWKSGTTLEIEVSAVPAKTTRTIITAAAKG
jgi:hypothetical protein